MFSVVFLPKPGFSYGFPTSLPSSTVPNRHVVTVVVRGPGDEAFFDEDDLPSRGATRDDALMDALDDDDDGTARSALREPPGRKPSTLERCKDGGLL